MSLVTDQPKKKWPLWLKWGVGFGLIDLFFYLVSLLAGQLVAYSRSLEDVFYFHQVILHSPSFVLSYSFAKDEFSNRFLFLSVLLGIIFYAVAGATAGVWIERSKNKFLKRPINAVFISLLIFLATSLFHFWGVERSYLFDGRPDNFLEYTVFPRSEQHQILQAVIDQGVPRSSLLWLNYNREIKSVAVDCPPEDLGAWFWCEREITKTLQGWKLLNDEDKRKGKSY